MASVNVEITEVSIGEHQKTDVKDLKDKKLPLVLRFDASREAATWWLLHYINGCCKWHKLGKWPLLTATDIKTLLPKKITALALDADAKLMENEYQTVNDLADWYVEKSPQFRALSDNRQNSVRSIINNHIKTMSGHRKIEEITHDVIEEEFISALLDEGLTFASIKNYFQAFKRLFTVALKQKKVVKSPFKGVYFSDFVDVEILPKPPAFYTENIVDVLGAIKAELLNVPASVFIVMLMLHGCRIGELRKAQWTKINLQYARWRIPMRHIKTRNTAKADHVLPLTKLALTALEQLKGHQLAVGYVGDYLFPADYDAPEHEDKPLSAVAANNLIQTISNREWTAHSWRKLFISALQELGIDYVIRKKLPNHSLGKVEQTYNHARLNALMLEALEQFNAWLLEHDCDGLLTKIIPRLQDSNFNPDCSKEAA